MEGRGVGAGGPLPALPPDRPRLVFGGFSPRSYGRMARLGGGWVAPLYGFDEYIHHYYGDEFFDAARADVLTTPAHLRRELERLRDAGCDDVLLFPCTANLDQPRRLAAVLDTPARES